MSLGSIDTSCILSYGTDHKNLENVKIVKVHSETWDKALNILEEKDFQYKIQQGSSCFFVNIESDDSRTAELNEEYLKYILKSFAGFFNINNINRIFILNLYGNIYLKKYCMKTFSKLEDIKENEPHLHAFIEGLENKKDFLNSKLDLNHALKSIGPETDELIIKLISLFTFNEKFINDIIRNALQYEIPIENINEILNYYKKNYDTTSNISNLEILALIYVKGITNYDSKIIDNIKKEMSADEREKFTDELKKFDREIWEYNVCSLTAITLSKHTESEILYVKNLYAVIINLNIDCINLLLKLLHRIKIRLDLECSSIERSFLSGAKGDKGNFDQNKMEIIVGVKNSDEQSSENYKKTEADNACTILHEVCHHGVKTIFNNNCKPYFSNDKVNEKRYKKIVGICKDMKDQDKIVKDVFYCYRKEKWDVELIVRVPQMIVKYSILDPQKLIHLKEKYKELFAYFYEVVFPQIKTYLEPKNELRRKIQNISSYDLEKNEIKVKMKPFEHSERKYIHFMESNEPELAMANIVLNKSGEDVICLKIEDVKNGLHVQEINSLLSNNYKITAVFICGLIDKNNTLLTTLIKELDCVNRKNHIFFIYDKNSEHVESLRQRFTRKIEDMNKLNFNLLDLTDESIDIMLQTLVEFQGKSMELNKIMKRDSKFAQFLPINCLIKSSNFKIGKSPEIYKEYDNKKLIARELISTFDNTKYSTNKLNEIFDLILIRQYIKIVDGAGKGKSTLSSHLAFELVNSNLPNIEGKFFVINIIVRNHYEIISSYNETDTNLDKFIFDNFVKTSDEAEFEWKLFQEFCRDGKVICFLNGIDHIPKYKKPLNQIVNNILKNGNLKLIITTRPEYDQKFNINALVLNLIPLNDEEQLKYLKKCLTTNKELQEAFRNSESNIDRLCGQPLEEMFCNLKVYHGKFVDRMMSYPSHLKRFAEVIVERVYENKSNLNDAIGSITSFNAFSLYVECFRNKDIMVRAGTEMREEISKLEHPQLNHRNLYFCATKLAWSLCSNQNSKPLKNEDFDYLKYFCVLNDKNKFADRSYWEFFIANLFIGNLIHGTYSDISLPDFAKDDFLISILTSPKFEMIKMFINEALSDDNNYKRIEEKQKKLLGELLLETYKNPKKSNKKFVNMILTYEEELNSERKINNSFVFIKHLIFDSLTYCVSEENAATIKALLEETSDIKCKYIIFACIYYNFYLLFSYFSRYTRLHHDISNDRFSTYVQFKIKLYNFNHLETY